MVVEDQLATKQDLAIVERNLSKKVDEGDSRLAKKLDNLEKLVLKLETDLQTQVLKITVRLGSLLVAGILVLAALIKL